MYIKKQEIEKMVDIILDGEKRQINYATIIEEFIKVYMDGRYHNYCGDINIEFNNKNKVKKLDELIKYTSDTLIKKYKGSDTKYSDKVYKFTDIFTLINYYENSKEIPTLKEKREDYSKKLKKYLNELNLKFNPELIDDEFYIALYSLIEDFETLVMLKTRMHVKKIDYIKMMCNVIFENRVNSINVVEDDVTKEEILNSIKQLTHNLSMVDFEESLILNDNLEAKIYNLEIK